MLMIVKQIWSQSIISYVINMNKHFIIIICSKLQLICIFSKKYFINTLYNLLLFQVQSVLLLNSLFTIHLPWYFLDFDIFQ